MNRFVEAFVEEENITYTENGAETFRSSMNECLDLFFKIGAIRREDSERVVNIFKKAYNQNPELAVRILLWARDVREGAGERRVFRIISKWLGENHPEHLLRIIPKISELGRFDDLLELLEVNNNKVNFAVLETYATALREGNALAAKWAPREGKKFAHRLMGYLRLTAKEYRKMLSTLTNVVETPMCENKWGDINYSHVPSVAMTRYTQAFRRHDNIRFSNYLDSVRTGKVNPDTGYIEKINTGAVYPYDVLKPSVDAVTADTMWKNLPNYVPVGVSFLPMVDVSASMEMNVGHNLRAMDVSISLGLYLAERNKSVFKDLFVTFSTNPTLVKVEGNTVRERLDFMEHADWGGSTDLMKALDLVLDMAVRHRVPQEDMPTHFIVLSDMEFDPYRNDSPRKGIGNAIKKMFQEKGYAAPQIIWWNIASRNDQVPVKANDEGMSLVSGFSPTIMKNLVSGRMTPESVMLDTVGKDRYAH